MANPEASRPTLFIRGDFTLRSGQQSKYKIECDALTPEDWEGLAQIAIEILPAFRFAMGVPQGGIPFARALDEYATHNPDHPLLICEDVVTTGGSMNRFRDTLYAEKNVIGVAAFARGPCPKWVTALFTLAENPAVHTLRMGH